MMTLGHFCGKIVLMLGFEGKTTSYVWLGGFEGVKLNLGYFFKYMYFVPCLGIMY